VPDFRHDEIFRMDDSSADDGVRPPGCLDVNARDKTPSAVAGRRKVIRHGTQYKKHPS
jgi:hypothetical protein